MSIFNELEKYASNIAVITEQSKQISYKDLLDAADNIGKHFHKRSLVFAVCKNCFESVAGYVGFMRAQAVLFLLNETLDNILFVYLLEAYKPEYIYLPAEKSGS